MAKQKIRIRLKAYEHRILDQSADKIVETAKELELAYLVQFHLPTERSLYTIIHATHKYKRFTRTIRNAYTQTSNRHCESNTKNS